MQPHIPFTFTLFEATGDLSMRKIFPALFVAHQEGKLHQDGRIICVAKQDFCREDYLAWVGKSAIPYAKSGVAGAQDEALWQSFLARITCHWQSSSAQPKPYMAGSWEPTASFAMTARAAAQWPEDR